MASASSSRSKARHHRTVAGKRPEPHQVRGNGSPRSPVSSVVVHLAGRQDSVAHSVCGNLRRSRILIFSNVEGSETTRTSRPPESGYDRDERLQAPYRSEDRNRLHGSLPSVFLESLGGTQSRVGRFFRYTEDPSSEFPQHELRQLLGAQAASRLMLDSWGSSLRGQTL